MAFDKDALTFDQMNEIFAYDPESGKIFWKVKTASKVLVGQEAGCAKGLSTRSNGEKVAYRYIRALGKSMAAPRVAWLLHYGEWPIGKLFTHDGNPLNTRIANLYMSNSVAEKFDHNDPGAHSDYQRAHALKYPMERKDIALRLKFDITLAEYGDMLLAQKGVCAICEKAETHTRGGKVKALAVDHDHETGKVRALLCAECNQMLGKAKDSRDILLAAVKYLDKHAGRESPAPTLTIVPTEGKIS
jgi:Recombination endonuclease VII/HNH endonuclease